MNSIFNDLRNAFSKPNNGLLKIILINVIVYLVLLLTNVIFTLAEMPSVYHAVLDQLLLPASIGEFLQKPWTLITYFFTHEGFLHILFNMLFLYWFGSLIMEFLGSEKFVNLFILGGLFGGLFYITLYNTLPYFADQVATSRMLGASGGVFAVVVGAATFMPNYTIALILLGPVRIKYIALFYVLYSVARATGSNAGGEMAHIAGAAIGFLFIKQLQRGNDMGRPITSVLNFFKNLFTRKPKVKVAYKSSYKTNGHRNSKTFKNKQEEIDAILDKISDSGYDSLTKEEKQKLFDASKN